MDELVAEVDLKVCKSHIQEPSGISKYAKLIKMLKKYQ